MIRQSRLLVLLMLLTMVKVAWPSNVAAQRAVPRAGRTTRVAVPRAYAPATRYYRPYTYHSYSYPRYYYPYSSRYYYPYSSRYYYSPYYYAPRYYYPGFGFSFGFGFGAGYWGAYAYPY